MIDQPLGHAEILGLSALLRLSLLLVGDVVNHAHGLSRRPGAVALEDDVAPRKPAPRSVRSAQPDLELRHVAFDTTPRTIELLADAGLVVGVRQRHERIEAAGVRAVVCVSELAGQRAILIDPALLDRIADLDQVGRRLLHQVHTTQLGAQIPLDLLQLGHTSAQGSKLAMMRMDRRIVSIHRTPPKAG
ncbi:hypothetical protein WME98_19960 [Sorangium sp. So ce296]